MFTAGSVFDAFGRVRIRLRSPDVAPLGLLFGLSNVTPWLTPDRFCTEYQFTGASFTHRPGPTGAVYARPRVESNPSPCDQATIAKPMRRPKSSDRVCTDALALRAAISESARRVN